PVIAYGVGGTLDLLEDWFRTVAVTTAPTLTSADNVSIVGMYAKWLGTGPTANVLSVATLAILWGAFFWLLSRQRDEASSTCLEMAILLILMPLSSPQGWDYVLLISTPAVMCLINYYGRFPTVLKGLVAVSLFLVGFSLFDLMGRRLYSLFMSLSLITVCYLPLLTALAYLRLKKVA
ncbi:MAG: hypothetical protein ACRD1T_23520, partial [Acidimicrobiia bacterium]